MFQIHLNCTPSNAITMLTMNETIQSERVHRRLGELLQERYQQAQLQNESFSQRAFARKLALSSSALSEIMRGKRKTSAKLRERILSRLDLDESSLIGPSKAVPSKLLQLSHDQYSVISDWYYFALLSLMETESYKPNVSWISKRLKISPNEVKLVFQRLKRLGMIEGKSIQTYRATGKSFSSTDGAFSIPLRRAHKKNLELAAESIHNVPLELRDLCAMTLCLDPKDLPEAVRRIRAFRAELTQFLESRSKQEVYKLCIQLFPLTHPQGEQR